MTPVNTLNHAIDIASVNSISTTDIVTPDEVKTNIASSLSCDFARVRRIVKTDEFSSVFRLRPVSRTSHFVLYARPNALAHARLGVVAAKRFAPRAATRNAIKRVTREIFRSTQLVNVDCIVRLSKPINTKAGPAITAALKRELRVEIIRLFASQQVKAGAPA
jgi:ribonuclease P protein component